MSQVKDPSTTIPTKDNQDFLPPYSANPSDNTIAVSVYDFPLAKYGEPFYILVNDKHVFPARRLDTLKRGEISLTDQQRIVISTNPTYWRAYKPFFYDVEEKGEEEGEAENTGECSAMPVNTSGTEEYVEICPHERLYFSRLREVTKLQNFKNSAIGIPAVTADIHPNHTAESGHCRCFLGSPNYDRYGVGNIFFRYARGPIPLSDPAPHPGVLLESKWILRLEGFPKEVVTKQSLEKFFQSLSIKLCPHESLASQVITDRVLLALESVRSIPAMDSLAIHRLEQRLKYKERCTKC